MSDTNKLIDINGLSKYHNNITTIMNNKIDECVKKTEYKHPGMR